MTASDWIAVVQAGLLAAAAFFAWRGYRLAVGEHREAREEGRKAPIRSLLEDVIREIKELAHQVEEREPGIGYQRGDLIAGHQQRLAVALTFTPPDVFNLFATRDLSTCAPTDIGRDTIRNACQELLRCFAEIEAGHFSIDQVALPAQRADPSWRRQALRPK